MAIDRDDEAYEPLVECLCCVANGAPLAAAASHSGLDGRNILELAMNDFDFAVALACAEMERQYWRHDELKREVGEVASACSGIESALGALDCTLSTCLITTAGSQSEGALD